MKTTTYCYILRTVKRHSLRLAACAMLACPTLEARAGTTYVISTDGAPLDPNYLQAIGASQGLSTPGFVFLSPTTLGSINGTPINFGGYSNNTAYFGVAGSLNLSNADRIFGVGGNFLHIEVGNDANISTGAVISVQAFGPYPGAGGGAGGAPGLDNGPTSLQVVTFPGAYPLYYSGGVYDHWPCVWGLGGKAGSGGWPGEQGAVGSPGSLTNCSGNTYYPYLVVNPPAGTNGGGSVRGRSLPGAAGTNSQPTLTNAIGGGGGAGGQAGIGALSSGGPTDGSPGTAGARGGDALNGIDGGPGKSARLPQPPPSDSGGLYGGAGGGGGAQGGYGCPGGEGGGGGGGGTGGADYANFAGGAGGTGGIGGPGGFGGQGGPGGSGGGGGGGLELVVRGVLNLQGIVSACGADGLAGVTYNSTVWQFGSAGESGHDADTPLRGQTSGGKGGDGGRGGDGGFGGKGGGGGGGAGGTIQIAASYITWGGVVDVSGGTGAVDVASSGLFRSRSDYDDAYNDFKAPVASRRNPYCSYDNTGVFLTGATDTNGNTANIDIITLPGIGTVGSELVGGPDTFGLAAADAAGSTADTNTPATVPLLFYTPPNAFGGVLRINTATLPELFFVNMTTLPLGQPALAVNRSGDPVQVPIRPLQVRGSRREPLFIPGAQGAQILTNLAPLNTWTTFLHAGDATASASFTPYSTPVTVSLVMSGQQGVYPTLWLLDTGLLSVGTTISTPVVVDRQTNSGACAPQTRAGVSGTVTVQIKNVGHPLSLMSSIAGSDATFSNLPPLAQSFDVSWGVGTSTNLGVQPPVSFKVASDAGTVNLTANLNVIGPIPLFNLTSGGSAGPVLVGQSASLIFSALNNFQVDPFAFSPPPHALYDLHILGVTVSGPDAAFFTLTGATNGLAPINTSIYGGANTNPWTTSVVFAPNAYRAYNATLSVLTDVNVAAGQPGKLFTYQLSGSGTNLGISISQQPADTLAQPGHMASFSVTAAAYGVASPLTYQWFRGASPVPYATNATYTSGPLSSTDNGAVFSCALSATPFAVSSAAANLIVVDTSTPYPQAVLADNPLLYYRFEEPPTVGTAYDSSTNGYNGLYYTDLSHADSASPSLGSSAVFHGDANPGMILCHGIPYLRTQFSVEAWAYLESWNTNTDSHGKYGISSIFSTGDSVQGSFRMGAVNSNIFQFNVAGAIDIDGVSDFQVTNNSYTTGKWFHLVAVYDLDNALFNFYVNGSLADSIALYDGGGSALIYPAVGAWWSTNGISRFLDGRVDELAIYGTPLTADRVAAHYQAAFAAVMGPLLTGTRQGGGLQLSWSSGPGFMLQQTTNPGDPSSWSNVTGGNISPVTVNLSLSKQFFRLRKL